MGTSDGTVLGNTKIVDAGPNNLRWNVVLVSEGYRASEMDLFAGDAQQFADKLLTSAPFDRLRSAINVFRVDVTSTDSGAREPTSCGLSGRKPKTYFDASFCTGGMARLLTANDGRVMDVVKRQVPAWHVALLEVNSPLFGGSGGKRVPIFSRVTGAADIALHEMGHSVFDLADEYPYQENCKESGHREHKKSEPSTPNITTNTNPATLKWRSLIPPNTPLPILRNPDCNKCDFQPSPFPKGTVGLFEGADHFHCRVFRPEYDCRMRNSGAQFCAVCQQVIEKKLKPFFPAA